MLAQRLNLKGVWLWLSLAIAAALLVAALLPQGASAARFQCPGTFRVLHDDRVGNLSLPRGNYRITILRSGRPSCVRASALFTRFLEDWDGVLPGGWRVSVANSAFVRRPGVGFHVSRVRRAMRGGGNGTHPRNGGRFCPTFRVLHNDRIGQLRLRKGPYQVILLQRRGLTCGQASALFTRFLEDFEGNLPRPWRLNANTAAFIRGRNGVGFRVKPAR